MEIEVFEVESMWDFAIITKNGTVAVSHRLHATRSAAVAAAELIAGSELKVVVKA